MSEIICECGHGIDEHRTSCWHGRFGNDRICDCRLSYDQVEIHHQLKQTIAERDALRAKLEIAKEALKRIVFYANSDWSHTEIANEALQKLEEK